MIPDFKHTRKLQLKYQEIYCSKFLSTFGSGDLFLFYLFFYLTLVPEVARCDQIIRKEPFHKHLYPEVTNNDKVLTDFRVLLPPPLKKGIFLKS